MLDFAHRDRGFTIIEVVVALAILSAVAGGALTLAGQNARLAASVEERFLARVLADNVMIEQLAEVSLLEEGAEREERDFAGRQWVIDQLVVETGVSRLKRVDLEVRGASGDQVLASVSTLKAE